MCEWKNPKEHNSCEKDYIGNPDTYSCKNCNYLASIIDESVVMWWNYRRNKNSYKKLQWKKVIYKTKTKITLLTFLLITTAFLTVTSIYYYLIKYRKKQKHLLPYYNTIKLKEIDIKSILWKWNVIMN